MIVYFADRKMNIRGHATTNLPEGFVIKEDLKTEEIETGVATFECRVGFTKENRLELEAMTNAGNYLLRSHEEENEFYTIIETEIDTKNQEVYIYAEDAGLDLLNEIVGEYTATAAQTAEWYVEKYTKGSGFEIGINEIPASRTRTLSWDGESTATERLASIATQFGGFEISFSFEIKGMEISHKYINIYEERGKNVEARLQLNREVDRIVTTKSVANVATALLCTGGIPEKSEKPINLKGYTYDDGDFYVDGKYLKSRSALEKWGRHGSGGHIVKQYSYDTTKQSTLCSHALTELKKICDVEINYEADVNKFPDNIKIGDRVNIVDDAGELYLSTRILKLETSIIEDTQMATLGEHLIKTSGISQKVADLAAQFAIEAQKSTRAYAIATEAQAAATAAQEQADAAIEDAATAQTAADEAAAVANTATQSAAEATEKAEAAQVAVDLVEENVAGLEISVANAQAAADKAQQAAETADAKAVEAQTAAVNAQTAADNAAEAAGNAQTTADSAVSKADTAQGIAEQAVQEAEAAATEAAAAKLDAAAAQEDIDNLGDSLTTLSNTMTADYARKTDLTEATAELQTQITQNANETSSTATRLTEIDETANDAAELAAQAQSTAAAAQEQADTATADALAAQKAADEAATAATNAQAEADNAKAAAVTAQSTADAAKADLAAAEADLATVQGRVDATEADILAAQEAVNAAQSAADKAQEDADLAAEKAATAQNTADTAVTNATAAQTAANNAADKATAAQAAADKASDDATAAQTKANEAAEAAQAAQSTADTAKANATAAQTKANEAATAAANAQKAADDADAKAAQAQTDLETAQQNLADVTSRMDATEEEIEAAQAAVETAQAAADKAKADAATAQSTADTAKANAATAQTAANNAKTAADNAQAAADAAQDAADAAQADVNALEVRIVEAETNITQNADLIALAATKKEVAQTLGGYYTKEETAALLQVESDRITSSVSRTYATKGELDATDTKAENAQGAADNAAEAAEAANSAAGRAQADIDNLEIGGRNLITGTANPITSTSPDDYNYQFITLIPTVLPLEDGKPYTISADVEILAGSFSELSVKLYSADLQTQYAEVIPTITNGHIEGTFPAVNGLAEAVLIYPGIAGTTAGNSAIFSNIKFEKGNKATDWSPAPEDVAADTATAQATADAAQGDILAAESKIEQLANAISMLVTDENGTTLLEQSSEGWSFNLADVSKALVETNQSLHDMQETVGTVEEGETVRGMIDALGQLIDDVKTRTAYIDMKTDENGDPVLELGKRNDNDGFKVAITNSTITFKLGSAEPPIRLENRDGVGYVVADKLIVEDEFTHGEFKWVLHDGNLGLL